MTEIERENKILYEKLLTIHTKFKKFDNSQGIPYIFMFL